jgi:rhodanese-related sulfurtransferase
MASVAPEALLSRIDRRDEVTVIDARTAAEFAAGHVPGAVNIPFQQMASRAAEVGAARHAEVVVYCGHGPRAWIAGAALRRAGFSHVTYLRGHWAGWRRARLRVERSS